MTTVALVVRTIAVVPRKRRLIMKPEEPISFMSGSRDMTTEEYNALLIAWEAQMPPATTMTINHPDKYKAAYLREIRRVVDTLKNRNIPCYEDPQLETYTTPEQHEQEKKILAKLEKEIIELESEADHNA